MVTSSAVVGSSAISRSGLQQSIMAISARWSIPPENSWGYWSMRFSGLAMPTFFSISSTRSLTPPSASRFNAGRNFSRYSPAARRQKSSCPQKIVFAGDMLQIDQTLYNVNRIQQIVMNPPDKTPPLLGH